MTTEPTLAAPTASTGWIILNIIGLALFAVLVYAACVEF